MNLTRDLFYSESEKILFAVAGYTDNTDNINKHINMLTGGRDEFVKVSGCEPDDVMTTLVEHSRRYKLMRVFYCRGIDIPPEEAFCITGENGWTMNLWLKD